MNNGFEDDGGRGLAARRDPYQTAAAGRAGMPYPERTDPMASGCDFTYFQEADLV